MSQVKQDILRERIYCPAEKAVLLASYAAQAKFGDFGEENGVEKGYLSKEKQVLAPSILSQHKLTIEEWEDKVTGLLQVFIENKWLFAFLLFLFRSYNSTRSIA